jgi:hypothetical protein
MTTPTSDPSRLLQEQGETEVSSLERSLLSAGRSRAGSPHMRAKVLAGLGLAAGSTALLTGTAVAASVSTAAKLTWGKLLLGVSLVGAVTAVPVGYYALRQSSPLIDEPAHRAIASTPMSTPAGSSALPAPSEATRAATLTDELGALDHARLALAGGDARRALDELDAYDRRFPSGRLQLEAEVLRIDAFAKVGRKDAARQHAEAFLRRHPNSVLTTRVRAHLGD